MSDIDRRALRARHAAIKQLIERHPDEFSELYEATRAAEGLTVTQPEVRRLRNRIKELETELAGRAA